MNPTVDRLVAYPLRIILKGHATGDLLGGEVSDFQEVLKSDFELHTVNEASVLLGRTSAPEHARVRVAFVIEFAFVGIAPQFTPHTRTTFSEHARDLDARTLPRVHAADYFSFCKREMCEARPAGHIPYALHNTYAAIVLRT